MTDLERLLQRLGLQQYLEAFVAEGFETWETVLDIQEGDLEALNVRLGHRRKLQRAIAEYRGISSDRPLGSPSQESVGNDAIKLETVPQQAAGNKDSNPAGSDAKRKYRRHPKPDEHAPEKPPSAYVLFSNRVREEVKPENLSFTDIARLVGERWQKLDLQHKELFESHAAALKESYLLQLAEYKKTDAYKEYTQYLAEFKVKHGNQNETKRPKLELEHTSSSLSAASVGNLSVVSESAPQTATHVRGDSIGSADTASLFGGSSTLQLVTALPTLNTPVGRRGTPPAQSRYDKHTHGQGSGQSSISEESNARFEQAETLTRAANLSIGTPPVGTPPSSVTPVQRSEHGHGYPPKQWSARQITYNYAPTASSGASPGNTTLSLSSSGPMGEQWRDKSAGSVDTRSFYAGVTPQPSSSVPISQLVGQEPTSASSQRTLPPLRQMTGTPAGLPFAPFGSSSVSSPVSQFQPSIDGSTLRQVSPRGPPNLLESEAAGTLAALADRREPFNTLKQPHNRPGR